MLKFLIDECLSPMLAGRARSRGFEAFHVNWLEKSGYPDHALMPYSLAGDYVFVTNNGVDFKPLYNALDLHPGLVIVLEARSRASQISMFMAVLDILEAAPDTVNKLIEVDGHGNVSISEFPASGRNR